MSFNKDNQKTDPALRRLRKRLGMAREAVKEEDFSEKQKLLQLSEISLVLDNYDDIFSDFDPRHYRQRALSDDLLVELKRATKEKTPGSVEIHFLIPLEQRKTDTENIIRKRLKEHFNRHYNSAKHEERSAERTGIIMVIIGAILSVVAAVYGVPLASESLSSKILLVLLEPAAWFLVWEGANRIFDAIKEYKEELKFNEKLSKAEVVFTAY